MTTTAPAQTAPPQAPASGQRSRFARLWRSVRVPAAVITVLAVVSVLLSLGAEQFPEGYLEPGSVSPDGSRALVNVLEQDRDVNVARSAAEAEDAVTAVAGNDEDAVLVLFLDHRLETQELDELAALDVDTVLVEPSLRSLDAFAPGVDVTGRSEAGEVLAPECELPAAQDAGDAAIGGELYAAEQDGERGRESTGDAADCYPDQTGSALLQVSENGTTTTVLGTGDPLTNTDVDTEGNAALAMNLMAADNVVWTRPEPPQLEDSASLWELIPEGVRWSLVPLVAALGLLALWRGRRMGALVAESLPVVVRASETTEGRAGLYRSRKARDRVAAGLRTGFLENSVPKLGLNQDSPPQAVVSTMAARTGEDPEHLRHLLYPGAPDPFTVDDDALVRLADELDERSRRLR